MAENQKPFFEIDLGVNGGPQRFNTKEEMNQWIVSEESFWGWLKQRPNRGGYPSQLRNDLASYFSNIKSLFNQFSNNSDVNTEARLRTFIADAYINNNVPTSGSPKGKFINEVKDSEPEKAEFILCYFMNRTVQALTPKTVEGFMSAFAFDNNFKDTATFEKQALEDLLKSLTEKVSSEKVELQLLRDDVAAANKEFGDQRIKNDSALCVFSRLWRTLGLRIVTVQVPRLT